MTLKLPDTLGSKIMGYGKAIVASLIVSGMAACASAPPAPPRVPPTAEELAKADHGNPPTDPKAAIQAYLERNLKDPDSVKYRSFSDLKEDWIPAPPGRPSQFIYGYSMCATYNAKNSYGAYVGYSEEYFFFLGDDVAVGWEHPTLEYKKIECS